MTGRRALAPAIRCLVHQLCEASSAHPSPCCNSAAAVPCVPQPIRSSHHLGNKEPIHRTTCPSPSIPSPSHALAGPASVLNSHLHIPLARTPQLRSTFSPSPITPTLRSFASSSLGQPGAARGPDSTSNAQQEAAPAAAANRQALGSVERKVAMVFTCTKCDTRSVKSFSRSSYERGVVLVRCPGCQKQHLIADHLGWFSDKGFTVEQLRDTGTQVLRLEDSAAAGGLQAEDLIGWSKVNQLIKDFAPSIQRPEGEGQSPAAAQGEDRAGPAQAPRLAAPQQGAAAALVENDGVVELSADEVQQWRKVQQNHPSTRP